MAKGRLHAATPRLRTKTNRKFAVTVTQRADPEVWRAALEAAGGDHRRLRVEPDGSVTVVNRQAEAD